jgi:glycosyltransferase involved in cell wall biosynthesis
MSARINGLNEGVVVWMNVTTSVEWTRPPVGIVRVEQSLALALEERLGVNRFKRCVWRDGRFIEHIPAQRGNASVEEALDVILPRTPTFEVSRQFVRRALERHTLSGKLQTSSDGKALSVSLPLRDAEPLEPRPGDVLISAGLDWDNRYSNEFFSIKKKQGLHIVTCCYDLIPVLFPHYCVGDVATRFKEYFSALTWGSSGVLCISEQTRRDYVALCETSGAPLVPTCVIPLGDTVTNGQGDISGEIELLSRQPFLLFVSTIERRKNHEVLYRAYRILCERGHQETLPKLVFVGMPGWGVGDLLKDIELDPLTRGLIVQLNHVTDIELNWLYRHAFFCVYPSLYEGWGLPVAEALTHGKAVLSSDRGSLPEVGGSLVKYLDAWNPYAWADAILEYCQHPERVREVESLVGERYTGRTWKHAADIVSSFVETLVGTQPRYPLNIEPGYDCSTQVGVHKASSIVSTGRPGYLMFGPFWSIGPGRYKIEVDGELVAVEGRKILFDCVAANGEVCLWRGHATPPDATGNGVSGRLASFEVNIDRIFQDFEIRCLVNEERVVISRISVFRL